MPRFVRPAWMEAVADGRQTAIGLGPRSKDGWITARLTLRTPEGGISDAIRHPAGPYVITRRQGRYIVAKPDSRGSLRNPWPSLRTLAEAMRAVEDTLGHPIDWTRAPPNRSPSGPHKYTPG